MFNYFAFVRACMKLSTFLIVYLPPNESALRSERVLRNLSRQERKSLARLMEWAERTDPGAKIRGQYIKAAWDNRASGADCIKLIG